MPLKSPRNPVRAKHVSGRAPARLLTPAPRGTKPAHSLRRNFSWSVIGEVTYAGCQWAMLVVLAKLGTAEMLGRFALGLAATAPVFMFTNLQLRLLQATDSKGGSVLAPYLTLRLIATFVGLTVVVGIATLSHYDAETQWAILMIGVAKAVEAVSDICHGRLQQGGDLKWVSVSLVTKGVLSLIAVAGAVFFLHRLTPVCFALIATWAAVLLVVDLPCVTMTECRGTKWAGSIRALALSLRFDWTTIRRLIVLGLPLGLTAMLISFNVSIPRFALERFWDDHAVGVYAALASLMALSTLPAAALGIAASSRFGQCFAMRDRAALRRLLLHTVALVLAVSGLGILIALFAGRLVLTLLYKPEYAEAHAAFVWLMLAAAGTSVCFILNWAIVAARFVNIQIPLQLGVAAAMIAGCWLWVPSSGINGAAWSVAAAGAVQATGSALILMYAVRSWKTEAA